MIIENTNEDENFIEEVQKKTKVRYEKLDNYDEMFDNMVNEKRNFTTESTTYTRKIKYGNSTIIFNEDGDSDFKTLALINKVRNDAKHWFSKNDIPTFNEHDIFWSRLTERPPQTIITKIDLKSAYWQCALKKGIITERTNEYLNDQYSKTKAQKSARLKAFGSLATKKQIVVYLEGIEHTTGFSIQPSRSLYMYICASIDGVMQTACREISGAFFYYWDCVFTGEESTKEVIDYILKKGYAYHTEDVIHTVETIGNNKYLITQETDKIFLNRKKIDPNADKRDKEKSYPLNPNDLIFLTNPKIFK